MKKILYTIMLVTIFLVISVFSVNAALIERRPTDNYYSIQNPPDFTWKYTEGATYSVVVATDKELTDIKYRADNIKVNVYTFNTEFEPGVYYWSYKMNGGSYATPYRFYIPETAYKYAMPSEFWDENKIEDYIRSHLVQTRPRLMYTPETAGDIASDYRIMVNIRGAAEKACSKGVPVKPRIIKDNTEFNSLSGSAQSKYCSDLLTVSTDFAKVALMASISREQKYIDFAIEIVNELTKTYQGDSTYADGVYMWDPSVLYPWNSVIDIYETRFIESLGLGYDWIYNDLNSEQRLKMTGLMETWMKRPYENYAENGKINGSLYTSPINSHGIGIFRVFNAALSVYEDSQLARELIHFLIPLAITRPTPFSYQDGISNEGLFYGIQNNDRAFIMKNSGIANTFGKAFRNDSAYRLVYTWGKEQTAAFGDSSMGYLQDVYQALGMVQEMIAVHPETIKGSINKWLLNDAYDKQDYIDLINIINPEMAMIAKTTEIKAPDMLPLSKIFPDTGWVSLNSSLSADGRIGMRFKSSPMGSISHAHPDQNSFVLNAYGENLLIDSNHFKAMGTVFDTEYNRKTWAHNSITFDGGYGQGRNSIDASGEITDFVYGNSFDIVKGSAENAYNIAQWGGKELKVNNADRTIIYLRPDVFIVCDDLEAYSDPHSYEFWLNTTGNITKNSESSAVINQNNAYLFADVVHPAVTSRIYAFNEKPDGTFISEADLSANGCSADEPDKRIMFKTDSLTETKMITLLSVNNKNTAPHSYNTEETADYIKITVADSIVYINKGTGEITCDNITFSGEAAVVSGNAYGIVNGKKLVVNGENIITSDVNVTVYYDSEKLSISSLKEDANVKIKTNDAERFYKTENEFEYKLTEGKLNYGIKYTNDGNYTDFYVYPSTYIMSIDDAMHEGYVRIDLSSGEGGNVKYDGELRFLKGLTKEFNIVPDSGYYIESVKFNGTEVAINNTGKYITPEINENSTLEITFKELDAENVPTVETYPAVFKDYSFGSSAPSVIVFGKVDMKGYNISECGIIYSYVDDFFSIPDYTLSDVDNYKVKKLKFSEEISANGYFGIKLEERRMLDTLLYSAKAYVIYNDHNGESQMLLSDAVALNTDSRSIIGTSYGDSVLFEMGQQVNSAYINSLSYHNGYIYPEFSPSVNKYVVGSTDGYYDSFIYEVPEGIMSEVIPASKPGESSYIKTTDLNGISNTYEFIMTDSSDKEEKASYATAGTFIQASDPDYNFPEGYNNSSNILYLFQYRDSVQYNRYVLYSFDLTEVNPFSDKIELRFATSATESSIESDAKDFKIAVRNMIVKDGAPGVYDISYNTSLGNGNYTVGEKLGVMDVSDRETITSSSGTRQGVWLKCDITDYVKKMLLEGKKEIVVMLEADSSNTAWWLGVNDKNCKIRFSQPDVSNKNLKPAIIWE